MNTQHFLAVLGALAGTSGSIVTAFSLNGVIRELDIARRALDATADALASGQRNIPVFTGLDERFKRASRLGSRLLWLGVALLAAGFILQAWSVVAS